MSAGHVDTCFGWVVIDAYRNIDRNSYGLIVTVQLIICQGPISDRNNENAIYAKIRRKF